MVFTNESKDSYFSAMQCPNGAGLHFLSDTSACTTVRVLTSKVVVATALILATKRVLATMLATPVQSLLTGRYNRFFLATFSNANVCQQKNYVSSSSFSEQRFRLKENVRIGSEWN